LTLRTHRIKGCGTLSALKQNSVTDFVVRVIAIAGLATPGFWLGIL